MLNYIKSLFQYPTYYSTPIVTFRSDRGVEVWRSDWQFDYQTSHEELAQENYKLIKDKFDDLDTITDLQELTSKLDRQSSIFGNALFDILNELCDPANSESSVERVKIIADKAIKAGTNL